MTDAYWIDTHCHLDFDIFQSELDIVIERALEQNVRRQVTISTFIKDYKKLENIAETYPSVFFSVGTHPSNAHDPEEQAITKEQLWDLTKHPKLVGIGEVGLDYHYSEETAELQKKSFLMHIAVARETQLPLIIHTRDADEDMEQILKSESAKGSFPFILHCYSSGVQLAKTGLELGGYISFSGISTFKNAPSVREVAKIVPKNKILVETDSPYLAPVPYRGKSNEPSYVVKTAEYLAEFLEIEKDDFARQTTENAYSIFNKMTVA